MRRRFLRTILMIGSLCVPPAFAASEGGFVIDDVPGKQKDDGAGVAADPCQAGVSEADGIVTLSITDPGRASKGAAFTLDDRTYSANFDGAGRLQGRAPMFHPTAELTWSGSDGRRCAYHGVTFKNFKSVVITALIWTGPYDLALHVVEPPGGRIGGPVNYVYPGRPNRDHATGLGDLESYGTPGAGDTQAQIYTLQADRNPRHGDVYYFVEFVSRGNPARLPFCGADRSAVATFKVIHLDAGQIEQRGGSFAAVPCGTSWNDGQKEAGYFQRWKWNL